MKTLISLNMTTSISTFKEISAANYLSVNQKINAKACEVAMGNFQGRKDIESCSLLTFNNTLSYMPYYNTFIRIK